MKIADDDLLARIKKLEDADNDLKVRITKLELKLISKKNCKFQNKCIQIAMEILNEGPIIEYHPPFLNLMPSFKNIESYWRCKEVSIGHNTGWYKDAKKLEGIDNRDRKKRCMCQDNGVFLLKVWYDEKPEIQKIKGFVNQAFKIFDL